MQFLPCVLVNKYGFSLLLERTLFIEKPISLKFIRLFVCFSGASVYVNCVYCHLIGGKRVLVSLPPSFVVLVHSPRPATACSGCLSVSHSFLGYKTVPLVC